MMSISLYDALIIPLHNVKLSYYTENGICKHSSDLHLSAFTEEGIRKFEDILNLDICAVNKSQHILYLKTDNFLNNDLYKQKVNEFWSLFTFFGSFKLSGKYSIEEKVIPTSFYKLHKKYFTFTDELINNKCIFV